MKKLMYKILVASALLSFHITAKAAPVVTVADDGVSNIGAPGTFYWALTNCSPGDTITFNIPGAGPFYLQSPPNGFPLIYKKHRITIDGYSQPGAVANSNPNTAANNAQLKIVIDGRNSSAGNPRARSLNYSTYDGTLAKSDPPINNLPWTGGSSSYGAGDFALLAIYRSTNVTIKGLAFLGDDMATVFGSGLSQIVVGISLMHDYGGAAPADVRDFLDYPEGEVRNCHIAGCWFGVNPANVTKSAIAWDYEWIDFPRHAGDDKWARGANPDYSGRPNLPNVGLTVGVAAGAANPRSEFNVFVGGFGEFGGEPIRLRVSGNFIGVMPDGNTPVDPMTDPLVTGNPYAAYIPTYWPAYSGAAVGCGRFGEDSIHSISNTVPMVYGTDGDGVNDADEGNLWGPLLGNPAGGQFPAQISLYRTSRNLYLVAGNRVGIANNGTIWTNSALLMAGLDLSVNDDGQSKVIIGSDFASTRSAATIAAQANYIYNNLPISIYGTPVSTTTGIIPFLDYQHPSPTELWSTNAQMTLRGNVLVGNGLAPFNYADNTGSLLQNFTNMLGNIANTNVVIIPQLNAGGSASPHLVGTFAPGVAPYNNVSIDVYQLDPQGWANGKLFVLNELTDYATYTNGFPQGQKFLGTFPVANSGSFSLDLTGLDLGPGAVTVTANYSTSPAGTVHAHTMTSAFSMPITLNWPFITTTESGGNLIVSWNPALGNFRVQTNGSVVSPGTWGDFSVGLVAPPVSVPIGTGTRFIRLKKP